jgi:hypothetical protein
MMQERGRTPRLDDRPEANLRRLLELLSDARRRASRLSDRREREELGNLLSDVETLARSLERSWERRGSARERETGRRDSDEQEMDSPAFRQLLDTVRRYGFDTERTTLIKSAARTASFTCAQVRELLRAYEWDSERRRALVALWPKVLDKRNASSLAGTFDWSAEWRSACRELGID